MLQRPTMWSIEPHTSAKIKDFLMHVHIITHVEYIIHVCTQSIAPTSTGRRSFSQSARPSNQKKKGYPDPHSARRPPVHNSQRPLLISTRSRIRTSHNPRPCRRHRWLILLIRKRQINDRALRPLLPLRRLRWRGGRSGRSE